MSRRARFCVWGAITKEGQVVRVDWGAVENPLQAVRALPAEHADLLAGFDSGRLKMRILLGGGCGLSARTAYLIAKLLRGKNPSSTRRGRPIVVVDLDGSVWRFPSIAAAGRALGATRGGLRLRIGGRDRAGRLVVDAYGT
jgi:hypothetical protein